MKDKLKEYSGKRDPSRTSEPFGAETKKKRSGEGLIFCVQLHAASRLHYDFRLEWDGALLSWAVPKGPSYNPDDKRLAIMVEDHPLDYAQFEGTIPQGEYGGGTVMLWDEGTWTPKSDVAEGLKKGELKFTLSGSRLTGNWALIRMNEEEKSWLLIKEKDKHAKRTSGISAHKSGVRSGRTMGEIERRENAASKRNPFNKVEAELAKPLERVPDADGMLYEIKFDGYRIVAFCEDKRVRLITRGGLDYAEKYPEITSGLKELSAGRSMVLDGELIVTDKDGRSDFHALQNYLKSPSGKSLSYMVFDLLALDGRDLRGLPLIERKSRLERLLKSAPPAIGYSRHVEGRGEEFFAAAAKLRLEGIVGKHANSAYAGGRNGDWVKIKCRPRQEFVVGGYTRSDKRAAGVSSLLLGVYEGKKLVSVGRAGSGFTKRESIEIEKRFKKIIAEESPFSERVKASKDERVFWLKPVTVAEIEYAELIEGKKLRQASFKGLREDKPAREVVMEIENGKTSDTVRGVRISNPDRVVYKRPAEITKLQVAEYYDSVAERMMPYVGGRILSVVRCHGGVTGECFFKKHPVGEAQGVEVVDVKNAKGENVRYFYLNDASGLISQAQLGTLEFHPWGSRAHSIDNPDTMVFDLDPDEGMGIDQIRQGVKDLKSALDKLELKSFLKTSGGKGYHIVVPFEPAESWDSFRDFARNIALLMEEKWPDRYTSNVRKSKRKGKIFIDWIRNDRGATSVAPYSLRARPGARVSMPISWRELNSVEPDGIDITEAERRLRRADPWKDYFAVRQKLK